MSYQVLARKWRPSNFSQVAGQAHVLKSLINALDNERLHHAYLFTGTRGVGKTTLARILAKCLNCEKGVSSTPCETCNACVEINEGRFVDLIEVDAASRTKVDDTRELLDNVQYSPSRGRFKVYLIDEVHMLSNHSFNALLKTLEEPPPHVKFLFATTDPQKLPVTILSRCLQFNLKNLNPQLIQSYLQKVLEEEQIAFDEEALWQLASAAAGSMRDALTLVDQAIAYCQGEIRRDAVIEMLGVPQHQQITRLLEAMAANSVADVLAVVAQLAEQTPDYANTLDSLLSALHRIALAQLLPEALDNSFGDRDSLQQLAGKFSAEDIQLYYQIGNKGREELRLATDLRAAFEMLLIRMLVFSPRFADHGADAGPVQQTASQNEQAEPAQDPEQKKKPLTEAAPEREAPDNAHQAAVTEAVPPSPVPASDSVSVEEEAASETKAIDPPEPPALAASEEAARKIQNEAATAAEARVKPNPSSGNAVADDSAAEVRAKPNPSSGSAVADDSAAESATEELAVTALAHEDWLQLYPQLGVSGIVGNVLANCVWRGVRDGQLRLQLDEGQSAVFNEEMLPRLEQALNAHFGSELSLQVEICQVDQETAAARAQRLRAESHQAMVRDFQEDEQVRALLERFSGSLATDSIVPLDKKTGA